ncbi:MAG: hypothetical protein JWN78_3003 [Bacteroidota bacterium]|nr:hypothetical protein [Bacteroidota bacterium]
MPKIKVPRKSTAVDMTAMCDVSFLLLTFFILTAKFRPSQIVQINTPTSTATKKQTDDFITISVDSAGITYLAIGTPKKRAVIMDKMIAKYAQKYPSFASMTTAQKRKFSELELIAFPIENIPQTLNFKTEEIQRKKQGIPTDSSHNELSDWIIGARFAYQDNPEDLKFAIKGDRNSNIKGIQKAISTLRDNDINNFKLITSQEGTDVEKK